jgi:hypothetical protein
MLGIHFDWTKMMFEDEYGAILPILVTQSFMIYTLYYVTWNTQSDPFLPWPEQVANSKSGIFFSSSSSSIFYELFTYQYIVLEYTVI